MPPSHVLFLCFSGTHAKRASPTREGPFKLGACHLRLAKTSGQMVFHPFRSSEGPAPSQPCVQLRSLFIPRSHKPRSFESKFRKRCAKTLTSALRAKRLWSAFQGGRLLASDQPRVMVGLSGWSAFGGVFTCFRLCRRGRHLLLLLVLL